MFVMRINVCCVFMVVSNDAAQSDDDDKASATMSDTDGGKLKQKT